MALLNVTQFAFDAAPILRWFAELRQREIDAPVRIGVGASTAVLAKYGISITKLLGNASPDRLIDTLEAGPSPRHGKVRLHFYPFGGLARTVAWINDYTARH
ncbi:MAG: hypothetical protein ABI395_10940 [Sphingobium sp.]